MKVLNHTLSANTAGQSMIHLVMEGEEPVRNQDALINEFLAKMGIPAYHFVDVTFQEGVHTMSYIIDDNENDSQSREEIIDALIVKYEKKESEAYSKNRTEWYRLHYLINYLKENAGKIATDTPYEVNAHSLEVTPPKQK